jgi:hypothetical protein
MPQFNMGDYGVVGAVLFIILALIWKAPDIIGAIKGEGKVQMSVETNDEGAIQRDETRELLQNLTDAISKLTTFLETESAVNTEKEKATVKQLNTIELKIDKIITSQEDIKSILRDHQIKCEANCHLIK